MADERCTVTDDVVVDAVLYLDSVAAQVCQQFRRIEGFLDCQWKRGISI